MSEKLYLMSENTKKDLDDMRSGRVIDLTSPGKGKRPAIPSRGGGSSGETATICKITGNSNAPEYSVEIYANGKYSNATGTGTLYVLDISYCERLLVGTWVIGHPCNLAVTSES